MQFRTRDFGMEWCKLKLALPGSAHYDQSSAHDGTERERNWFLEGDTSDLEVWELEASQWIDPRYLSYKSCPRRRGHIFSFRVQPNSTHVSREVHCPADKIVTFEIFCVSPGCRVDIWQNKLQPPMGSFKYHSYRFLKFIWLTQVCSSSKDHHFEGKWAKEWESERNGDWANTVEHRNCLCIAEQDY